MQKHLFLLIVLVLAACGGDANNLNQVPGINIDANGIIRLQASENTALSAVIDQKRCNGTVPDLQRPSEKIQWVSSNCLLIQKSISIVHPTPGYAPLNVIIMSTFSGTVNESFFTVVANGMLAQYPPSGDNIPFTAQAYLMLTPRESTGDFPPGNLWNYKPYAQTKALGGDAFSTTSIPVGRDNTANVKSIATELCQEMEILLPDGLEAELRCNGFGLAATTAWMKSRGIVDFTYGDYVTIVDNTVVSFNGTDYHYRKVSEPTWNLLLTQFQGLVNNDWYQ